MVKQLLVLGDSFCHGIGTASVFKNSTNCEFAFGKHVADHLDLHYVNLAEPGSSVARTVENGYAYLSKNQALVHTVIVGWTQPNRIGLHSPKAMLQILPSYILLGDHSDSDVFVEYEHDVKFITDRRNQQHLSTLPKLHQLLIQNDLLEQESFSMMQVELFRTWLNANNINYVDFSVFGHAYNTMLDISFNDVMIPSRHPTIEEQKKFAELLIQRL